MTSAPARRSGQAGSSNPSSERPGIVELGWLASAILLPAVFDYGANQAFELPKLLVLTSLGLAVGLASVLTSLVDRRPLGPEARWMALAGYAWLVAAAVSAILSVAPSRALWGSYDRHLGLLAGLGAFGLALGPALCLRTPAALERLAWALAWGSMAPCLYAIAQANDLDPLDWLGRPLGVTSTLGSSTTLGGYLAIAFAVTYGLVRLRRSEATEGREPMRKTLMVFAAVMALLTTQCLTIGLTWVRGAILGAALGLGTVAWLARPLDRRVPVRSIVEGIVIAILVLAGFITLATLRSERTPSFASDEPEWGDPTVQQRLLLWQAGAQALPVGGLRLLIGHGPDTQAIVLERWLPTALTSKLPTTEFDRVHLSVLDSLLTIGLVGTGAAALVIGLGVRTAWRYARRPDAPGRAIAAGLAGGLVAHLVESSVGYQSLTSLGLVGLVLGAVVALGRLEPEPRRARRAGRLMSLWVPAAAGALVLVLALQVLLPVLLADRDHQRALAYRANELPARAVEFERRAFERAPQEDVYALQLAELLVEQARAAPRPDSRRPAVLDEDPNPQRLLRSAVQAAERAVALTPNDAFSWSTLARTNLEAASAGVTDPSAGLIAAERAAALDPARAALHEQAARAAAQAGAYDRAIEHLERAIQLDGPQAERLAELGHVLRALGMSDEASRLYEYAIALDPRAAAAWHGLARIEIAAGQPAEALEPGQRAARFQMRVWQYRRDLGLIYRELADLQSARSELRTALRFAPAWEWPALRELVDEVESHQAVRGDPVEP